MDTPTHRRRTAAVLTLALVALLAVPATAADYGVPRGQEKCNTAFYGGVACQYPYDEPSAYGGYVFLDKAGLSRFRYQGGEFCDWQARVYMDDSRGYYYDVVKTTGLSGYCASYRQYRYVDTDWQVGNYSYMEGYWNDSHTPAFRLINRQRLSR